MSKRKMNKIFKKLKSGRKLTQKECVLFRRSPNHPIFVGIDFSKCETRVLASIVDMEGAYADKVMMSQVEGRLHRMSGQVLTERYFKIGESGVGKSLNIQELRRDLAEQFFKEQPEKLISEL